MIFYVLKQNKNAKSVAFGKFFAYPVIDETVDLDGLADHMSSHNTPYSKGAIKGMLTDMVSCIKELLLEGKNVKIADLAIFSLGIRNNGGAVSEDLFSVVKHIKGVRLRARATGELISKSLRLEAQLRRAKSTGLTGGLTGDPAASPDPSQGGENNDNGGGTGGSTGGGDDPDDENQN
jgi:predicted histone-like DNA-binding protein